jgi:hypothetical protein
MTALPPHFVEDRALRDAARAVLEEDIARLRASLDEQGVASRVSSSVGTTVTSRLRTGAEDVLSQVKQSAGENQGIIALVIGAILLWLMRGTILDVIEAVIEGDEEPATGAGEEGEAVDATDRDADAEPELEASASEAIEDEPV